MRPANHGTDKDNKIVSNRKPMLPHFAFKVVKSLYEKRVVWRESKPCDPAKNSIAERLLEIWLCRDRCGLYGRL